MTLRTRITTFAHEDLDEDLVGKVINVVGKVINLVGKVINLMGKVGGQELENYAGDRARLEG